MSKKSTPRLEDLKFVKNLGSGNTGIVKLMEDADGTPYALKVAARENADIEKYFQDEYSILKTLGRAGFCDIVPNVYNLVLDGQDSSILMEALGKSLSQEIEEKGFYFSEKDALQIGLVLLSHVRRLHDAGVIHGDLNQWNVVRRGPGKHNFKNLCLVDFEGSERTGQKRYKLRSTTNEGSARFNQGCRWDVSCISCSVACLAGAVEAETKGRLVKLRNDVLAYLDSLKKQESVDNIHKQPSSAGHVDYEFVKKLISDAASSPEALRPEPRKLVRSTIPIHLAPYLIGHE